LFGRVREAWLLLRASIDNELDQPDFHSNLATLLGSIGRLDEAGDADANRTESDERDARGRKRGRIPPEV